VPNDDHVLLVGERSAALNPNSWIEAATH
jgi:hypothetical protein